MGPWATAIVAASIAMAVVVIVLAFRGLIETLELADNRCASCGRLGAWPLPTRHTCWRCRHPGRAHLSGRGHIAHRLR